MTHARSNYEEEVRVPLLMIWDDRLPEGRRVRHPAQLADVLPTLTSLLGIEADAFELDGTDLLPYVRGAHEADPDRPIFLERPYYPTRLRSEGTWLCGAYGPLEALRSPR